MRGFSYRGAARAFMGAAVFLAAGSSFAASVQVNSGSTVQLNGASYSFTGSGTFAYSSGKVSNDVAGGISIAALGGALINAVTHTTTSQTTSLTLDTTTGAILGTTSVGGEHQIALSSDLMTGGTLDVLNLSWNASNKTFYADVHGVSNVLGDLGTVSHLDFFKVNSVTGATAITGAGTYTTTLSGIYLTADGLAYIDKSLGLGSLASAVTAGTNFGVVTDTLKVTTAAAVPEPATFALMGLGMLGLGLVRRRQQRQVAQA